MNKDLIYVATLLTYTTLLTVGVFDTQEEAERQLLIVSGESKDVDSGWVTEMPINTPHRAESDARVVFSFEKEQK